MNFEALLSTALSLFLFILIGFVLYKAGVVDTDLTKKLSGFVAKAAQPFLIIWSVVKLEYSPENLKNGMIVLGFSVLLHIFLALAAKLFFSRTADADERKIHEFGCIFTNCAFVGFPILNALFGEAGLFYGAFYVIVYNLAVWSYGVVIMARGCLSIWGPSPAPLGWVFISPVSRCRTSLRPCSTACRGCVPRFL